jgi:hypothetical protein
MFPPTSHRESVCIFAKQGPVKYDPDGRFFAGHFVPTDVWSAGHFVRRTFCPHECFVRRTFCLYRRFVPTDVLFPDILSGHLLVDSQCIHPGESKLPSDEYTGGSQNTMVVKTPGGLDSLVVDARVSQLRI